jgi:DtxR family Mn-dependent transcriptional regulator
MEEDMKKNIPLSENIEDYLETILEVDETRADETACRMEHAMDGQSFKKFVAFIATLDACPYRSQDTE